jgi:hypothetical protein
VALGLIADDHWQPKAFLYLRAILVRLTACRKVVPADALAELLTTPRLLTTPPLPGAFTGEGHRLGARCESYRPSSQFGSIRTNSLC